MKTRPKPIKDFAGLNQRFRPARAAAPGPRERTTTTTPFTYKPTSVRNQKVFNHRMQSWMRHSLPRVAAYIAGGAFLLYGGLNTGGILTLRGSQVSLVNNLLLVFTGCFLVFLASHERAVERGTKP